MEESNITWNKHPLFTLAMPCFVDKQGNATIRYISYNWLIASVSKEHFFETVEINNLYSLDISLGPLIYSKLKVTLKNKSSFLYFEIIEADDFWIQCVYDLTTRCTANELAVNSL